MTIETLVDLARSRAVAAGLYYQGYRKHAEGVVIYLAGQPRGAPPQPGDAEHHWAMSVAELAALTPADVDRRVRETARMIHEVRRRATLEDPT